MEHTFQTLIDHELFPKKMRKKLEQLKFLRERPDFHPEKSANEHIKIVTNRLTQTGDIDLVLTGIFHDIHKFDTVEENPKSGYPTSPGHDAWAAKTVRTDTDVQAFIEALGGNVENVAWLCEQHMRVKQMFQMKHAKQALLTEHPMFEKLIIFTHADDMINTFEFPLPEGSTWRTYGPRKKEIETNPNFEKP